ncbi:hypothetical protein EMIHUDRAFT_200199 [Emiliania huxleyi CCMP1516]|uniref:Uncharacterized protein n=2 Tax=Emiliania huxleyi TaxID=2903 RepID=A0A0D3KV55_EMIH1|nr:hypothetical protein EMIHUDRAFT_200199 [Emiliania huxleyi CCMP1516]EOD39640.1 hypothetical protein EMIHUDRAFT_200199 [Emiliania huxleyi CCMP1516]|eukprot:XP_005792069.1 hypothetical protein EMIHUDRAFT_200199 [Emiliania huxleyi CCMP1516]
MRNHGRKPPGKAVKRKPDRQPAPKGGVVHDAVQQAVMQYGYDDELFQDWRDGKIGEKDLPEEVMMAMTLDLCERWRAEQERTSSDTGGSATQEWLGAGAVSPACGGLPPEVPLRVAAHDIHNTLRYT